MEVVATSSREHLLKVTASDYADSFVMQTLSTYAFPHSSFPVS